MLNLRTNGFILVSNVKLTCDLLSNATHLDCHIPIGFSEITGFLMEYLLDCFRSLDQNGCTPIYGKPKYVLL